jgi:hypothetical protein
VKSRIVAQQEIDAEQEIDTEQEIDAEDPFCQRDIWENFKRKI